MPEWQGSNAFVWFLVVGCCFAVPARIIVRVLFSMRFALFEIVLWCFVVVITCCCFLVLVLFVAFASCEVFVAF